MVARGREAVVLGGGHGPVESKVDVAITVHNEYALSHFWILLILSK